MLFFEIKLLALALAMDAAAVSFAYGLLCRELPRKERWIRGALIGFVFGFFQFLMLWMGSLGGYFFSFSAWGHLFQFVAGGCFVLLAIKCFQESFEKEDPDLKWGIGPLLLLGLATSIDALAAGVSLGTLPQTYFLAFEVGLITTFTCTIFYWASRFFNNIPDKWLLRIAGVIFGIMAIRILLGLIL